jgi:16S rRNA (uracil1498-N3)-methyltransferase
MVAALKQSGSAWLPALHPDAPLARAIAAAPAGVRVLLDVEGEPILRLPLRAPVTIVVGPEGGVTPAERDELVTAGFASASLAPTVLRFETAGIAALAVVRAVLTVSEESSRV